QGRLSELVALLSTVTTVCRGPKPAGALRRAGLSPSIGVREPYTTAELIEALGAIEVAGRGVAVFHYGEQNDLIAETLLARGAQVSDLCVYAWRLPIDREPLRQLVRDLIAGRIGAIAFTTQVQARHLFAVATELDCAADLTRTLNEQVVTASVGPTCAAAVAGLGVSPRVVPEHPKMGHLIRGLAQYYEANVPVRSGR
ncbi:MAG TPA: uroporphyrinogen-III synthase, partial [Dehalococcoidia bacterium]|nr:uroporphyrinogen-III synthase [Dehalococcoidia bacterium]